MSKPEFAVSIFGVSVIQTMVLSLFCFQIRCPDVLRGHGAQHFFRHFVGLKNARISHFRADLGHFGSSRKHWVLPSRAVLDLLFYMVRSTLFRGVGCQLWGVKSRKSQNLAKTLEFYILKVADSEYPCARFFRSCFGVSGIELLVKFH